MAKLRTAVLSVFFSVLLIGQAAAAPVVLTDAAAHNTHRPSADSTEPVPAPQLNVGSTVAQNVSFSMDSTQRVLSGTTYTTGITVTTDKRGLLSGISDP
jgi:hypothetical protein